ncbi:cupin domain-containing protein [Denitromonas ohlonensis]|uniref:Cytoplasmic protein n=2 Tax=Denitromonas TaxID=139331 RepID=A0A557SE02_9RHOO|nr:cytoplasmic protein [Denitromonas ohlonensis]TVO64975.1 cytoplasmic protein [Denitromonas ohlonensis]TVO75648.1 cytoplasmic protein [Denitromonas ohlonensis]
MRRTPALLVLSLALSNAFAQDPVVTDGDKYTLVLENEQVRVLEYRDLPGETTHPHHHPAFVLYAVSPFKRSITLPDGKVIQREFKAGDVMYSPAQTHIGTNTGSTPTHAIMVELKAPAKP